MQEETMMGEVVVSVAALNLGDSAEFEKEGMEFLRSTGYFISKRNTQPIELFLLRIHELLTKKHNNRIGAILTGSKQCGKTTLMLKTIQFLEESYSHLKICAVFFECRGRRSENVPPCKLLIEKAKTLKYLTEDELRVAGVVTIDEKGVTSNDMRALLTLFADRCIFPLVFYDEAEHIWALEEEHVESSLSFVDELHAIGNSGCGFGCLSGSSWKLLRLAYREELPSLVSKYPSFPSYQSLNHQKYGELSLYPLTDIEDACEFLNKNYLNTGEAEKVATLIVQTGGRFRYMQNPQLSNFNIMKYRKSGIEWRVWSEFMHRNEALLMLADREGTRCLIGMEPLARGTIDDFFVGSLADPEEGTNDLVDRDVLIAMHGAPHEFLPACIDCVLQLWKFERSHILSLDLVRALRYPLGRPNAELLEWYCNVDSLDPTKDYIALSAPGIQSIAGRSVHVTTDLTPQMILSWADNNKRLKPFVDAGVDMFQFRKTSTSGRWPRHTVYVDCIQIKLSDQSTIDRTLAATIIKSMTKCLKSYVDDIKKQLSIFTRTTVVGGDMYVHTTWNISQPARDVFLEGEVSVVEGKDLKWHENITSFCTREKITWMTSNHP